jgi:hypothetical protein
LFLPLCTLEISSHILLFQKKWGVKIKNIIHKPPQPFWVWL